MFRKEKQKAKKDDEKLNTSPSGGTDAPAQEGLDAPPRAGGLLDRMKDAVKQAQEHKKDDYGKICACGGEGCNTGPMRPRTLQEAARAGIVKWDSGCGCFS